MKATPPARAASAGKPAANMSPAQAIAFVERHGVVLEASRRAGVHSLVDAIANEPVKGNWWSHPHSRAIFAVTRAVRDSADVLVCRLVDGRISFVHARLWPALARLAHCFAPERLARLREVHAQSGAHRVEEIPWPQWLPQEIAAQSQRLDEAEARAELAMLDEIGGAP
jgi:hypothetical protein